MIGLIEVAPSPFGPFAFGDIVCHPVNVWGETLGRIVSTSLRADRVIVESTGGNRSVHRWTDIVWPIPTRYRT